MRKPQVGTAGGMESKTKEDRWFRPSFYDALKQFFGIQPGFLHTLQSLLYTHQAGDKVDIVIYRSGRQYRLTLTIDQAQ